MATPDVFNNPANNYVNPSLSPCLGAGDDSYLEFLPNDTIGVVQGGNTLAGISFSDIKIPVSAYSSQKKVLEPGEVSFIPGLTKGLSLRSQSFTLPFFGTASPDLEPYFMTVDLSIGFYKNFGYKVYNLEASANYAQNVSITDALNIAFSNILAKVTSTYDPSDLTFTGTQAGWDFNISHVELTVIDASENALSPFTDPLFFQLDEDLSKMVLYAKYPNSAMQGIILKATYPSEESPYSKWFQINHVPDIATIFNPVFRGIEGIENIIHFDPSITFGPFITDLSLAVYGLDVSDGLGSYPLGVVDSSFINEQLTDSSLYNCRLNLASILSGGILENSWVNKGYPVLPYGDFNYHVDIEFATINESSIYSAEIFDSSLFNCFLLDVSLVRCTLYNCTYDPSLIYPTNCTFITINESIDSSMIYDSSVYYQASIKTIEVGMSGCSTSTAMSAGDYLEWITENEGWEKVGDMYIWTSAPDADDTRNLIPGFYVFNPQLFNIQLEYLSFV